MRLTKADVALLFRIATDIVVNLPKIRTTGSTYRRSDADRLGGLVRFSYRFEDYGDYGVVSLTDAGWRRVAAEARRRVKRL